MHLWQDLLRSERNVARPAVDGTGRKRLSDDSEASEVVARHLVRACCRATRFLPDSGQVI